MIDCISKKLINPSPFLQALRKTKHLNLTPWDLELLSDNYIQWGVLYPNPPSISSTQLLNHLEHSLSSTLHHFYPLAAGRFKTNKDYNNDNLLSVFMDLNAGEGVPLVHAIPKDVTSSDVSYNVNVKPFTRDLFSLNGAINHDGHSMPLLAVQVTELADSFFIGLSMNHCAADGTSFMHFLNSWAEISRQIDTIIDLEQRPVKIRCPPTHEKWFLEEASPPIKLPSQIINGSLERYSLPSTVRERMFHFLPQSIANLKSKANLAEITSFQALSTLLWRCVTRARCAPENQKISCRFAGNDRRRLQPPLPNEYFGCAAVYIYANTTAGELLSHGDDWSAMLMHKSVVEHTNGNIRTLWEFQEKPRLYRPNGYGPYGFTIGGSPMFYLYSCKFGYGRALAIQSCPGMKHDGKVTMMMGKERKGSVAVEVILERETMDALESNEEFMSFVS